MCVCVCLCVFVRICMNRQKGREENSLWNDDASGKMLRTFYSIFWMDSFSWKLELQVIPFAFFRFSYCDISSYLQRIWERRALKCIIKTLKPVLFCILNGILNWETKSFPAEWPWNNAQGIRLLKINKYLLHILVCVHVCVWPSVALGYRYTTLHYSWKPGIWKHFFKLTHF